MLPCKRETESSNHEKIYNQAINNRRHLLSATNSAERCAREVCHYVYCCKHNFLPTSPCKFDYFAVKLSCYLGRGEDKFK